MYDSIHNTPCYIWFEIHEKKNFEKLIISTKHTEFVSFKKLADAWEKIYDEFIQMFPPMEYFEKVNKMFEIAQMRFEAQRDNNRSLLTLAKLEEEKLNSKNEEIVKTDFYKNCALMQKHYGIKINPLKISIFEYHNNLKALSK
jgi:hypothetical protein